MKISTEPMENRQVSLKVEMEPPEVEEYLKKAYIHLVDKYKIPGFRKGKAPRTILERHIGKETMLQEALEHLIPDVYEKALDDQKIEPFGRPEIELIQSEPVIFKAVVPMEPAVKLGDYTTIRVESKPVVIEEKEVEAAIQQIRLQHASLIPVERPAKMGDAVTMDVEGDSKGKAFHIRKDLVYELVKESPLPLPGFAEKIEGITKGEERNFSLSYPADYKIPELAGNEYAFKIKASEIKEQQLPEVNDDFAKNIGAQDLNTLNGEIKTRLQTRAEEMARLELEQKILDAAVEQSELEYPPVLVEHEIDRLVEDEARNFTDGLQGLENYLKNTGKTMKEHRDGLRNVANRRVVRSLVLEKIAESEKITASDDEINEEIERMLKDYENKQQAEDMRNLFNLPQPRKSVENLLISKKTMERLKEIAAGSGKPATETIEKEIVND